MKKLLLLLAVLGLTGCNRGVETSVEQPNPYGEYEQNQVFAHVIYMDDKSVEFTTDLDGSGIVGERSRHPFAENAVVLDRNLQEISPEDRMKLSTSSYSGDYDFYITLDGDEVVAMRQAQVLSQNFDSNSDDLVYVTNIDRQDGKELITVDPMQFLSCEEAGKGDTCPDGYAIENPTVEALVYEVPSEKIVISIIDWAASTAPAYPMSFEEFMRKFSDEKPNFSTTPYHLQAEGNQVVSLTEKYLP